MQLQKSRRIREYVYSVFNFTNIDNKIFDGNGFKIDGNNKAVHLAVIYNCKNLTIRNIIFTNGNTEVLKYLNCKQIPFRNKKQSIFEFIDGGAVLITGNSSVTFENCKFIANKALMCGGAVSDQSTGKVVFRNCTFQDNLAGHTGSAIDNLVVNSSILVEHCNFENNISNIWYNHNAPHGQISLFPSTKAIVKISDFRGKTIPIDFYKNSELIFKNNTKEGNKPCNVSRPTIRQHSMLSEFYAKIKLVTKLWWVVVKLWGRVRFRT